MAVTDLLRSSKRERILLPSTPSRRGRYWLRSIRDLGRSPGGLVTSLRWLVMYVLGRSVLVRRMARAVAARRTSSICPTAPTRFEADVSSIAGAVERDGFDARLRLPSKSVAEIASSVAGLSPAAPYSLDSPLARSASPAITSLAEDGALRTLASIYLGTTPEYVGTRIWWLHPTTRADPLETGARFHYDLYDYRAITFLIYLTDVDLDAAPHVCVRGSHRERSVRNQLHPRRHRSDEEIARRYGAGRVVTITGPAGTVIAEDPFCFHRVSLPAKKPRLALQLLYAANDFPAPSFLAVPARPPSSAERRTSITR